MSFVSSSWCLINNISIWCTLMIRSWIVFKAPALPLKFCIKINFMRHEIMLFLTRCWYSKNTLTSGPSCVWTGTRLIDFPDLAEDGPLNLIERMEDCAHVLSPSDEAVTGRVLATLDGAGRASFGLAGVSKSIFTCASTPSKNKVMKIGLT